MKPTEPRGSGAPAFVAALAALALGSAACSKAPHPAIEERMKWWHEAGLILTGFGSFTAEALGKADCQKGEVSGIETVVCVYREERFARRARRAGLAHVGETTGLALVQGNVLIVLADRKELDPAGKTMQKMVGVLGERAPPPDTKTAVAPSQASGHEAEAQETKAEPEEAKKEATPSKRKASRKKRSRRHRADRNRSR